jgi:hypothetical protein
MFQKRLTIVVGHFGSGKTEIDVNGAMKLAASGLATSLVDLDFVKPYFRSRSAGQFLKDAGVELVSPDGENEYADMPMLLPRVRAVAKDLSRHVIMDVGGDDTGAKVLGSIADVLDFQDLDMVLVLNFRRPFTPDVESALIMASEIEGVTGRKLTGILSNTHLMDETTFDVVKDGFEKASATALAKGLPVKGLALEEAIVPEINDETFGCPVLRLSRAVRPVFDEGPQVRTVGPLFVLK